MFERRTAHAIKAALSVSELSVLNCYGNAVSSWIIYGQAKVLFIMSPRVQFQNAGLEVYR